MGNWYNFENDGSGWETEMEKLKSEWEKILERTAEQRAHNGISLFFQKEGKNPCWLGKGYADVEGRKNIGKDTGLRHFIFDRFLKNALFTAFRQYFFVKFPAFYCCMVLYIYLACVIIFL